MAPKPQENISSIENSESSYASQNCNTALPVSGYVNSAYEKDKQDQFNVAVLDLVADGASDVNKNISSTTQSPQGLNVPIIDFDDLLPHIGEFGKYQRILFLCMIPFAFFIAFTYFSQIFITLVPEQHWCRVPELELDNLSVEQRRALSIPMQSSGAFSKCQMYAVNYTELLANGVKVADPSWPIVDCRHGWNFNFSEIPYSTIATEQEWVCKQDSLPALSQSIFFLGSIVGGLLFGWIADHFGRVPALVGCNFVGFVAGISGIFANQFWEFALTRFFVGFAFDNCFTMMYILVLEYVGPKWRTFVANMSIAIFFTLASCALPWIAYYVADWRMFVIITSAPLGLALLTPFFVPESARWLVSQGKIDKAIQILKKFEKVNGKKIEPQIYKDFSESCIRLQAEEAENSNYNVLDLFKTPRLRNTTILLIIIWMAISLVFDGHVRNVGSLGFNFFITFTVACATEFPADTLLTLTLDRWGRRWLACGTLVASGLFSLLATAVSGPASAVLAILGRFSVNISYNIGIQYAAELLPTVVRAQGVAFIHIMGYVASIIAPFVVYLEKVHNSLPLIVLGILGVIGGLLALLLPETLGHELPQTLADGEEFGRGQRMWDFPCCGKKTVEDDVEMDSHKDKGSSTTNFTRSNQSLGSTGASLRASTRGEFGSSMLQRSIRSRRSTRSLVATGGVISS